MTRTEETTAPKSWLERLVQALIREPQDREQLIDLLYQAAEKKIVDQDALGMIEGVLQVSTMQVRDIMIPRAQMVVVEQDALPKDFLPIIIESKHSRFPVIGEDRDEIVGILLAKDLLRFDLASTEKINLKSLLRRPVFVPESKRLNVLLREFRAKRNHMAVVVDEYGGIGGLVTIEDVLEQIVGEISDEYDTSEAETIKKISPTQYNVAALTSIDDFNKNFGTDFSDEEFDTMGGLVLQQFGHLPKRGESVTIKKFHFKVLHANHRRIHLLRVTLPKTKK
jgi:magnesium and cobalt transporter